MEFDIGNILYIVITLVAVIVGLLGKKKKPASPGEDGEDSEARPSFMENLERALRMGQDNPDVADLQEFEDDLPSEVMVDSEAESDSRYEPMKAPSIMDDYERIMQGRQEDEQVLEVIELDEEGSTGFLDMVEEFDAKTAVVYSAILNRLDY